MDGLTLCFPTYYHCVVKDNTNSFQYNSVSILLLGQKREQSQEFLTDTMVSNYVNGKKPLPDAILSSLLLCNTSEIENRLKLLDFQGLDYIISSLVTLVNCVSNLSASEKAHLIDIASHQGKEYEFLSIAFQNAIRCPTQFICSIDRKLREQIQAIKATAFSKNNEVATTTYKIKSHHKSEENSSISDSEFFDVTRATRIQLMDISFPFEYENVVSYLDLARSSDGVATINNDDILSVFSYGTRNYKYVAVTITGAYKQVKTVMNQISIIDNSQSIIMLVECTPDISENDIKAIATSIQKQHNVIEAISYGIHYKNNSKVSICSVKMICCLPKSEGHDPQPDNLPVELSLFELIGIKDIKDLNILERWKLADTSRSLNAPIGVTNDNNVVSLDIHEKADGPNGLIAGMVGSGKSELIISYILSMALHYPPDEVSFIIIDLKGSGIANQFLKLPHLKGILADADPCNVARFFVSIKSELCKRQNLFKACGVKNINEYIIQYKNHVGIEAVPHMIVVVDEFAFLKAKLPTFMEDLIGISQVGRSLGIHLILATQRPAGAVNDVIWSNSKFRICLKVATEMDSMEIIRSALAYTIDKPGRAYLQSGNVSENIKEFQCAYSGKKVIGNSGNIHSELKEVIDYIINSCEKSGTVKSSNICLPPLERIIPFTVTGFCGKGIPLGIYDCPHYQCQGFFSVDFETKNLLIIGSAHSGKSNLLQCIIRGCASRFNTSDINMYVVECTSTTMKELEQLNVVGGVIHYLEEDRLNLLINYLHEQIEERKSKFIQSGVTTYIDYKKATHSDLPRIILLIDNLTALLELYVQENDQLLDLCQLGLAYGISFVVTAPQVTDLSYKYRVNFASRIAMYCRNSNEYSLLFDRHCDIIPDIPGRCIVEKNNMLCECQTFIAFGNENDIERAKNLEAFIFECNRRDKHIRAFRIPYSSTF